MEHLIHVFGAFGRFGGHCVTCGGCVHDAPTRERAEVLLRTLCATYDHVMNS